jgi:hypothetical protein
MPNLSFLVGPSTGTSKQIGYGEIDPAEAAATVTFLMAEAAGYSKPA